MKTSTILKILLKKTKIMTSYMCGYRKGFSTEHAILSLIEKWKMVIGNKEYSGAILIILKAFKGLQHY